MTLNDREGHLLLPAFSSAVCAAIEKIWTDIERRAIPLRQPTVLLEWDDP